MARGPGQSDALRVANVEITRIVRIARQFDYSEDPKKSLHSPGSGLGFGVSAHLHAAVQ